MSYFKEVPETLESQFQATFETAGPLDQLRHAGPEVPEAVWRGGPQFRVKSALIGSMWIL
jgi:hypothetical protein